MSVAPVLVLTRPPGSGKTTVADLLAARFDRSVHLESDLFFRAIRSGYVEPWRSGSHEQNRVVVGIVSASAASYAKAGYFTIIDGVILPHRFLEPVREALSLEGLGVALAILRPTLAVCTTRATQRLAAPLDVPGVIEELRNGFADLGDLERCVIDSGELDAAMTTDVLFARFENGVLSLP